MAGRELDDCRSPSTYSGMATLQQLLIGSSRTFSVGIDLLPEPLRQEITVAYLLLRVSDYLEDSELLADDDKIAMLEDWRRALAGGGERTALIARLGEAREDTPDALVARDATTVLAGLDRMEPRAREIVVRRVRESTAGMARWTRRGSVFNNEADLDDYMHEVAGRVGLLPHGTLRAPPLRGRGERGTDDEAGKGIRAGPSDRECDPGTSRGPAQGLGIRSPEFRPRGTPVTPGDLRSIEPRGRHGRCGQTRSQGGRAPRGGPPVCRPHPPPATIGSASSACFRSSSRFARLP